VHLPELGSPLRYLAIGPTGAFIITPANGRWTCVELAADSSA
jgi:hypothetical protein